MKAGCLFAAGLIALAGWNAEAAAGPLGPGDKCAGIGLVRPPGGLYGSIYVVEQKTPTGSTYRRAGYLPSGISILLHEPPESAGKRTRDRQCMFSYRGAVSGFVERRHVVSLDAIAAAMGIDLAKVAGFVAPANPAPESRLKLYKSAALSEDEVLADLGRNDTAVIFLMAEDDIEDADALKVVLVKEPLSNKPERIEAFIKTTEDRCCDPDGTYRIFNPRFSGRPTPVRSVSEENGFKAYLLSVFKDASDKIGAAVNEQLAEIEKLKGCQAAAEVVLKLELKAGFGAGVLSITPTGSGQVKWTKPAGEILQFARVGNREDLALTIRSIAKCSHQYPMYLDQAHIIIGNIGDTEDRSFVVDREEFFQAAEGDQILSALKKDSIRLNTGRPIAHLFVVPRRNGQTSAFYFTLFDRFDRFIADHVFGIKNMAIDRYDRVPIILLTAETLSLWQN